MKGNELAGKNVWLAGSEFLTKPEGDWPEQPTIQPEKEVDEKKEVSAATSATENKDALTVLLESHFDWFKLKKIVAILKRFTQYLQAKTLQKEELKSVCTPISAEDLQQAEHAILKYVQRHCFEKEVLCLQNKQNLTRKSSIYRLDPYMDENGLLRVGGRLRRSTIPQDESRHPLLLPYNHRITTSIIQCYHHKLGYAGRNHTLASIREMFWIIKRNSAVRGIIGKCVKCRRLHHPVTDQKIAYLPEDRVNSSPNFTVTGCDAFGPYIVKEGRKSPIRYGLVFTCMACRAIHRETVNSLETDSFIQALRRFIARRGNVKIIRCDNGMNFVGAIRELKKCLQEVNKPVEATFKQQGIQ